VQPILGWRVSLKGLKSDVQFTTYKVGNTVYCSLENSCEKKEKKHNSYILKRTICGNALNLLNLTNKSTYKSRVDCVQDWESFKVTVWRFFSRLLVTVVGHRCPIFQSASSKIQLKPISEQQHVKLHSLQVSFKDFGKFSHIFDNVEWIKNLQTG